MTRVLFLGRLVIGAHYRPSQQTDGGILFRLKSSSKAPPLLMKLIGHPVVSTLCSQSPSPALTTLRDSYQEAPAPSPTSSLESECRIRSQIRNAYLLKTYGVFNIVLSLHGIAVRLEFTLSEYAEVCSSAMDTTLSPELN